MEIALTVVYTDEDLIKYAWPQDVWFHVDKLSSAHVYLRMPPSMTWDSIPEVLLADCAQLVKANSIEGAIRIHPTSITGFGMTVCRDEREQEG